MLYVAQEVERTLQQQPQRRGRPAGEARPHQARRPDRVVGAPTPPASGPPRPSTTAWCRRPPTAAGSSASTRRPARSCGRRSCPGPTWQSPVVVDDVLIQGDCNGVLHGYDVSEPRGRAARALDRAARGLHRVHADGVQGPDLRRRPRRRRSTPSATPDRPWPAGDARLLGGDGLEHVELGGLQRRPDRGQHAEAGAERAPR